MYVDGHEAKRWKVAEGANPRSVLRLREEIEVQTRTGPTGPRDGFVVVRVEGAKPLTPIVGDGKRFTVYPFALTNPLFLDANGDGQFTPVLAQAHGHSISVGAAKP